MRTNALPRSRDLSAVAEHQMRTWPLRMESQQRLEEAAAKTSPGQLAHPSVAISREAGVDATEIAQEAASKLNWKVFDRALLDHMVDHYHWSRVALAVELSERFSARRQFRRLNESYRKDQIAV